jgi:HlyD family secretion protein
MTNNISAAMVTAVVSATIFSCADTDVSRIEASGTIEAVQIRIAPKVGALAERMYVDEGDRVSRGDTILVLDRSVFELQLRQARAGVELAQAQLDLMVTGAREEDIRTAAEALRQSEASLGMAREDLRRMHNLFEADAISRKQFEDAEARYTIASAQNNAAAQNLEKVRQLTRPEEMRAQRARLEQARSTADLIEKSIEDCSILSPATGVVTQKIIETGELAAPGSPVAVISKLDTVRLTIYLTTEEVGRVRLGQDAEVAIDAFPDRPLTGRITYISPSAEFTPRNIQTKDERVKQVFGVRVEIPNPDGLLKPGLPADAVILTDKSDG